MSARDLDALLGYLAEAEARPFAWGRHDCVRFAGGAVEAATGRKPALPTWTSERGALRVLARLGGLEAAVDGVLTRTPAALAQRGDVALVDDAALGVVEGEFVLALSPDAGLVRLPRSAIRTAWSAT